jgi:proteic killer suppression protein
MLDGMIRGFRDRDSGRIWSREPVAKSRSCERIARRKLVMLHNAASVKDLRSPPGNRLEALKGDREGQYSIRINAQYRICFVWRQDGAHEVEITDYH